MRWAWPCSPGRPRLLVRTTRCGEERLPGRLGDHLDAQPLRLGELGARAWPGDNQIGFGRNRSRDLGTRSEEHTSELQSLMRISYAVFCLKKKKNNTHPHSIK